MNPVPADAASDARRFDALTSVAEAIARTGSPDDALAAGLDVTLGFVELELGGIYLLDEENGELRLTSHHRGGPADYVGAVTRFKRGEGVISRALVSREPLVIADLSSAPEARDATRALGLRSFVFVPLFAGGRAVGVMAVGGRSIREFTREDVRLLAALGGMLGSVIENARLMRSTQRHLDQVKAVWEIDRAIVEDRDLDEVLGIVAREAGLLGGGDAAIALIEGERGVRLAGSHGEAARRALGEPPALAGTSLETLLQAPGSRVVAIDGDGAPARALVVPLRAGERTLGGLVVVKPAEAAAEDELTILSTFAHQAAVALAKARVRDAEGRRAGQLALVSAASEIASSTLDVDALLGAIARYVQRSFQYYAVSVYLVEPDAREARLVGAAGAATLMPRGHRVRFGKGVIGWVAEHGEYVLTNDVRQEPRFVPSRMEATRSELAVPVRLSGEVVAVVNVESDRLAAFDEGDVVALDAIAAQVASAIRNARVFAEKLRALRSLEILQEITNVLNSELDLDALLERIARRSVEAVKGAQRGAVLLYDGEALRVRSSFGYANPGALEALRLAFHEGLPGSVFVSGQGRVVAPPDFGSQAAAFRAAASGATARCALGVPVALPREKLGVLLLENAASVAAFEAEDLRFAATLANQAAIAIGNALRLRRILELDRQRQDFLSNVSHELRTPLTVVQGYLEALADGSAGAQAGEFVRVARDQAERLGRLIDEVLEVSRLEQGVAQKHVEWTPVALAEVVARVVQSLRGDAAVKGVQLAECLAPGLPALVGDERLLRTLVFSLVENAVKFTPPGGSVEVGLEARGAELLLGVADTGIGIPEEHRERIFEKFYTVDAGVRRSHRGAGIGLYLVREIAAIHAGVLRVASTPEGGTLFEVRLPLRPAR